MYIICIIVDVFVDMVMYVMCIVIDIVDIIIGIIIHYY